MSQFRQKVRPTSTLPTQPERKKFSNYFCPVLDEANSKREFANALTSLFNSISYADSPEDFDSTAKSIYDKSFRSTKSYLRSSILSRSSEIVNGILRLVKEAKSTLDLVIERLKGPAMIKKSNLLNALVTEMLITLRDLLIEFTSNNAFDLYSQSP
ncbi:hypothetical protein K458DRAFT_401521 [Lentithecium fluviatile CBS 122367]|uniref:Uncharacterized protein n=1 Tax=Lentithecium fluviatile CBS 122367 TaxID=1168545 RepID=A0A6G1JC74_9PLEO|nr:hypothetical protein K458DRAFT_401521 [Lentithecium fluviatile CBS 122367]